MLYEKHLHIHQPQYQMILLLASLPETDEVFLLLHQVKANVPSSSDHLRYSKKQGREYIKLLKLSCDSPTILPLCSDWKQEVHYVGIIFSLLMKYGKSMVAVKPYLVKDTIGSRFDLNLFM